MAECSPRNQRKEAPKNNIHKHWQLIPGFGHCSSSVEKPLKMIGKCVLLGEDGETSNLDALVGEDSYREFRSFDVVFRFNLPPNGSKMIEVTDASWLLSCLLTSYTSWLSLFCASPCLRLGRTRVCTSLLFIFHVQRCSNGLKWLYLKMLGTPSQFSGWSSCSLTQRDSDFRNPWTGWSFAWSWLSPCQADVHWKKTRNWVHLGWRLYYTSVTLVYFSSHKWWRHAITRKKNKSCFVTEYPWVSEIGKTRWVLFRLLTSLCQVFLVCLFRSRHGLVARPCRWRLGVWMWVIPREVVFHGFPPTNQWYQCFASAKCILEHLILINDDKCWQCHLGITLAHLMWLPSAVTTGSRYCNPSFVSTKHSNACCMCVRYSKYGQCFQ